MSPTLAAAAVAQGDIDYVAGVGPASVAATLTGLPSRAIWFSSDRISYWLQSATQYKTVQELKGQEDRHLGRSRRHKPCGAIHRVGEVRRQPERFRDGRDPRTAAASALLG